MMNPSWGREAREWSAVVAWWAILIFAGWIVYTQVVQRPDCQLLPPDKPSTVTHPQSSKP